MKPETRDFNLLMTKHDNEASKELIHNCTVEAINFCCLGAVDIYTHWLGSKPTCLHINQGVSTYVTFIDP